MRVAERGISRFRESGRTAAVVAAAAKALEVEALCHAIYFTPMAVAELQACISPHTTGFARRLESLATPPLETAHPTPAL